MYKKIYKNMRFIAIFTLILTVALIVSISFAELNSQIKRQIERDAFFIAEGLNENQDELLYISAVGERIKDQRITLILENGEVIYDNNSEIKELDNHRERPEVARALENGTGRSQRRSKTLGSSVYYYAVKLKSGNILRVASLSHSLLKMLVSIIFPIVFVAVLIYALAIIISTKLTANILKPIENIDVNNVETENVYEELRPFIRRISGQNKEIKRQMEKVRSHKSRLQTVIENMNEGLIVIDEQGFILSANAGASAIFHMTVSEMLNSSFDRAAKNPKLNETVKYVLKGNKITDVFTENETPYQIFFSPVLIKNQPKGAILLFFDISEKNSAEHLRREFSANVSHELKTPLTTILGYSQMIGNGMAKAEDIAGFGRKIEKECTRLINLVEDIIKLSNLDESGGLSEHDEVNLLEACIEVVERLEGEIKAKNVEISLKGDNSVIIGSYSLITEMIFNLVQNAVKYNKDGGRVEIEVSDKRLTVSDTGIGISAENQQRIFERFFRVDKSRSKKVDGTGLGLSIVKHIASCHDASVSVKSVLDKGTTMTVDFNHKAV